MSDKVFVYGTLKKGCYRHSVLEQTGSKFLGSAILRGYCLTRGRSFPYLRRGGSHHIVVGEVYEIMTSTLDVLDRLEGTPYLYTRETIGIPGYGNVYAYVVADGRDEFASIIPHGYWRPSMRR